MEVETVKYVKLKQADVQQALLDYVGKMRPDIQNITEAKITASDAWNFTVPLTTKE
jgi:hypothetical protein